MTLLAFLLPFFFFILYPSRLWNFDGVACAAALELGNPAFLFHSNHLLYGFLGFLFWKPLSYVGLPRALPGLQLFTSLLSAGGLAGLYALLRGMLTDKKLALLLTLSAGVSAVVWVWSIEAQVYALGFLALSWATREILQPETSGKWRRVGLLHAGAVLGHVVHVIWIVPALYWLSKENPRARTQNLRCYLTPLAIAIAVPYAIAIAGVILPANNHAPKLLIWLMGSAALNPNSLFQWHFAGLSAPLQWAAVTPRIFWGSFWPYHTIIAPWCGFLTAISIATVIFLLGVSWKKRDDRRWTFSLIWLAVYGVFFWTWEPRTECYRMTDILPIVMLMGLGITTLGAASQRWAAAGVLFVTFLSVNLVTRILPMNDQRNNLLYQETLRLADVTPGPSIYLTGGGLPWLYLLYFEGRTAWDLQDFQNDPKRLTHDIDRHFLYMDRRQSPVRKTVFVREDAQQTGLFGPWAAHYTLVPIGYDLPWGQIQ